ncbi:MAG TPA: tyrosine-type recombinase/integrase [Pseudomonadales bacterium]
MGRRRRRTLPKYLERHPLNGCYYYKNPSMPQKANLGTVEADAVDVANRLNTQFERDRSRRDAIARASERLDGVRFEPAFTAFVEKYIRDYRLKSSTAARLRQRRDRLNAHLGNTSLSLVDTQALREVIASSSQFEQTKLRTLLSRFFQYAISVGAYPGSFANPVDNLYVDPNPPKRRTRMTLAQFRAIHDAAPEWLQWLMTLGIHLALRRVDLVNLRFDDIAGDRIVSPIRKTDSDARGSESISVDFPIHRDVRAVLIKARRSSLANGRCPFIIHRTPDRKTKRAADAMRLGRMEHPAQVLPEYASKAFAKARALATERTTHFAGLEERDMPTLHEIRALSSYLYAVAGYDVDAVQDLMAHTDPDMTRAYQKGHARKVVRVEMILPFGIRDPDPEIREARARYAVA